MIQHELCRIFEKARGSRYLTGAAAHCEAEYSVSRFMFEKALDIAREHGSKFYYAFEHNNIALTGFKSRKAYYKDLKVIERDISSQIKRKKDIDRVVYRIVCRDGTVKRVLDYGRFVHTEKYGNVYYSIPE